MLALQTGPGESRRAAMARVLTTSKGCVRTDETLPAATPLHRLTSVDTPSPEGRFASKPSGHAHASSPVRGASAARACGLDSFRRSRIPRRKNG